MTQSAEQKVEQMISTLKRGKNIHDLFVNTVKTGILLQGKTMDEWTEYFHVDIPAVPDIADCKNLNMRLMELHQEATFLKCMAEASLTLGRKSYTTQYREKFSSLVSEYKATDKKLPAKETLETLATNDLDDIDTGLSYSELGVKFWKDILEDLNFKRRSIETTSMNLATEAKALNGVSNGK